MEPEGNLTLHDIRFSEIDLSLSATNEHQKQ
jgi:hypothetical protein